MATIGTFTRTGGMLGSAAYMAPEQHEKPHEVDHRADIYSLGATLYTLLAGRSPLNDSRHEGRLEKIAAVMIGNRNVCPIFGQRFCNGPSDPLGSTGDNRHFSL